MQGSGDRGQRMSFVSREFAVFYPIAFVFYYASPAISMQNTLIVVASYVFYGWWDWRFLPLLASISLVNYSTAIWIDQAGQRYYRNILLAAALAVSLGALALFKYFDFFSLSLATATRELGLRVDFPTLHLILPLGISFMTFQGMAYVIDVWRGEHPVETNLIRFLAFKAFFPQLIAGPIERANHLLVQFARPRTLTADGAAQAIWLLIYGYTLKIAVADALAPIVDSVFVANQPFGFSVILGTIAFGLQIYADFYGYSLIAKGLALLLGFELIWNFRFPYWASSPSDFWRRWHISLSRWLRDYLYIPLGGNRSHRLKTIRNLYVTMLLGGLWHGASWNFVLWGFLHGTALAATRYLPDRKPGRLRTLIGWALTMTIVFAAWFFFRAMSYDVIIGMLAAFRDMEWAPVHTSIIVALFAAGAPLFLLEYLQQRFDDFFLLRAPKWVSYPALSCLCFIALVMGRTYQASFIYFQF